jgi:hypothetical protein
MSLEIDEAKARRVLEEYKVEPHMYHFGERDIADGNYPEGTDIGFTDRIKSIVIAYPEKGAVWFLRDVVIDAISRIALDSSVLYAGDLRDELEWVGIHGVAIRDSRDTKYGQRARTISIGRLRKSYEIEYYQLPMPEIEE